MTGNKCPGILRCFFRGRTSVTPVKLSSPEARAGAHEQTRALILLILAFIVAAYLRFPAREAKPMHVDETTQAVKLGELMDGKYHYDSLDHHGPTLLYATLPVKWFSRAERWSDLTESQLRLVPVLFGMGLLLLLILVGDGLTASELAWGAMAVAVSPLMVFYSRYYIMEMLLVFFTFGLIGCGWRFYLSRQTGWLVGAGILAGLMHATKETCVLQFAAISVGLLVVWMADLVSAGSGLGVVNRGRKHPIKKAQVLALVLAAVVTSVLIFSKFLTDWRAVYDSVATYWSKLDRAEGQGHQKPFFYYLGLIWGAPMGVDPGGSSGVFSSDFWKWVPEMLGIRPNGRIVWGERLLLVLALIGMVTAFVTKPSRNQSRHLVRFLAVYSVAVFLIYSAVSYKTPWLVIGPWHGMLILAGVGAAGLMRLVEGKVGRLIMGSLLVLVMAHAGLLAYRATRGRPSFAAHVKNPLNYSMTTADCLEWVEKIYRLAEVSGKGEQFTIVQADSQGGWPLPWFMLRKFPNYVWQGGDPGVMDRADLILSGLDFRASLPESVRGAGVDGGGSAEWVEFPMTLHPTGRLAVFIRKPLWSAYLGKTWPPLPVQK